MKTLQLFFISILFFPSVVQGQSKYIDLNQSALSIKASALSTTNYSKQGELTLAYTMNNTLTFRVFYSRINTFFDSNTNEALIGNGIGGSISTMLMNELESDPLSIELGILFEHSNYDFKETENSLFNNSIGVDLSFSKRLEIHSSVKPTKNPFLITFGLSAFPYSESKLDMGYRNQFNSQYAKVYVGPSFILGKSSQKIFLEPTLGYNFVDDIFHFSMSLIKIF